MSLKEGLPKFPEEGDGEQALEECTLSTFKMETELPRREDVAVIGGIEPGKPRGLPLAAKSDPKERSAKPSQAKPSLAAERLRLLPPESTNRR